MQLKLYKGMFYRVYTRVPTRAPTRVLTRVPTWVLPEDDENNQNWVPPRTYIPYTANHTLVKLLTYTTRLFVSVAVPPSIWVKVNRGAL